MKKTSALLAAPVLVCTLLAPTAAIADAPKIDKKDFPTVAQVGAVFGDLKGAKREMDRMGSTSYTTSCTKGVQVRTKRDMHATYWSQKSKHVVQVSVSEMKSTKLAKKVLKGARTENKCGFVDVEEGAWFTKTRAPKVGNEAVGRLVGVEEGAPKQIAHYIFRKKNRVIELTVIGEKKPNLAKARKLAKVVYKVGV